MYLMALYHLDSFWLPIYAAEKYTLQQNMDSAPVTLIRDAILNQALSQFGKAQKLSHARSVWLFITIT